MNAPTHQPRLVDKTESHDDRLLRGSDAVFADDESEWIDAELADYESWHARLIGHLVDVNCK